MSAWSWDPPRTAPSCIQTSESSTRARVAIDSDSMIRVSTEAYCCFSTFQALVANLILYHHLRTLVRPIVLVLTWSTLGSCCVSARHSSYSTV